MIRWTVVDGELIADPERRREGVFKGFEPGESDEAVDGVDEHDRFGVE